MAAEIEFFMPGWGEYNCECPDCEGNCDEYGNHENEESSCPSA
jgi:hypothetical protein